MLALKKPRRRSPVLVARKRRRANRRQQLVLRLADPPVRRRLVHAQRADDIAVRKPVGLQLDGLLDHLLRQLGSAAKSPPISLKSWQAILQARHKTKKRALPEESTRFTKQLTNKAAIAAL